MPKNFEKTAEATEAGLRLDLYLKNHFPGFSRGELQRSVKDGSVSVNGEKSKSAYLIKSGDRVGGVISSRVEPDNPKAESIPLDLAFEDRYLAVVNKPAGLTVHPGSGRLDGTLVNALLHRFPKLSGTGGPGRPGLVHRLDRETSGLILVAKTDAIHEALAALFRKREIKKTYRALVWGRPKPAEGVIDRPLARSRSDPKRWKVAAGGRAAQTAYQTLRSIDWVSELLLFPKTGRTHQIRVHLASIGAPVMGDRLYGGGVARAQALPALAREAAKVVARAVRRQLLHAEALDFIHPKTGRRLRLTAAPPPDMAEILRRLWP